MINTADTARRDVVSHLDPKRRSKMGQFMTPSPVARYMASLFSQMDASEIRLLDPGAGVGSLTAAFLEELFRRDKHSTVVRATCYELEVVLADNLKHTFEECQGESQKQGVALRTNLVREDFIHAGCELLNGDLFPQHSAQERFTHVIMNPPYKKIRSDTTHRKNLQSVGIETSNLYTAFLALAIRLLEDGGELVAIVPRSFCNGLYFRPFRTLLHDCMALRHIHVFHSRKKAFKEDDVLQENIIFHAVKGANRSTVTISSTDGPDFTTLEKREVTSEKVIDPTDSELFLWIATSDEEQSVVDKMGHMTHTLTDLGLEVCTGPVVDFRLRDYVKQEPESGSIPLIYASHFDNHYVSWPKTGGKKPNAIVDAPEVDKWLMPNECYTLTKRFSAKEERRRIVAAVFDPRNIEATKVAFENHLNVFHSKRRGLLPLVAKGLAVFLNSTIVDRYFRVFSGHTQVNATDLRNMRYPSNDQLLKLGRKIRTRFPKQERIDSIVDESLFR